MTDWWRDGRQPAEQTQPAPAAPVAPIDDNPAWVDADLARWADEYRQAGFRPEEITRIIYYVNRADQEMGNIAKPRRNTVTINYGAPIRNFHASLTQWGFKFRAEGDQLRVTAPSDVEVSPLVWDEIRKRKSQLIALLKGELDTGKQGELLEGKSNSAARSREKG